MAADKQGANKAARVLLTTFLKSARAEYKMSELRALTSLSKTAIHRALVELEEDGQLYVVRDDE